MAEAAYVPRLLAQYREQVVPALQQRFNYGNPMPVPRLVKTTINVGLGEALQNARLLETAVLAHPFFNTIPRGEVRLLAVPAMLDRYMERLTALFEALGHAFSEEELGQLGEKLGVRLERAYRERANSYVTLVYEPINPPRKGLRWLRKGEDREMRPPAVPIA